MFLSKIIFCLMLQDGYRCTKKKLLAVVGPHTMYYSLG